MKKRILIVEDDEDLARVLRDNFEFEGFEVDWVAEADRVIARARDFSPDLIILDIVLRGSTTGFDLCGILREGGRIPIMMLTAKTQRADRLHGFELGADDYITKPFDVEELLARTRAIIRRARPTVGRLMLGAVVVDFTALVATRGAHPLHLTHREFELLQYLAERRDYVVPRQELLRNIWGYAEMPWTRCLDHAIRRLRKKIESDPQRPQFIHTVFGDGYSLTPDGAATSVKRRPLRSP